MVFQGLWCPSVSLVLFSCLFLIDITLGSARLLAPALSKTDLGFLAVGGGGFGESAIWKHGAFWQASSCLLLGDCLGIVLGERGMPGVSH